MLNSMYDQCCFIYLLIDLSLSCGSYELVLLVLDPS